MTAVFLAALTRTGVIIVSVEACLAVILGVLIVVCMAKIAKNKKCSSVYRHEDWTAHALEKSSDNGENVAVVSGRVEPFVEESRIDNSNENKLDESAENIKKPDKPAEKNAIDRSLTEAENTGDEDKPVLSDAEKRVKVFSMEEMYASLKTVCAGSDAESEAEIDDDADECGDKITFVTKMKSTSMANKLIYNIIKNELLSYKNVKSRVTNGGDYFRFPGTQFAKIILIGKTLRLAIALEPSEYDYNIYHQKDRSGMIKYANTPMFVKVQSKLGVERAVKLIGDCMKKFGLGKSKKFVAKDFSAELNTVECAQ